jgi:hypothetical protein
MFVCIRFFNENIVKVVPGHWVDGFEKIKKKKIDKTKTFYTFFSPNPKCEAKFEKKLYRKIFDPSQEAIYKVAR